MEASPNISCPNVTVTDSFLIRILGSLGAVSVATCLFALCWLFCLKLHRQFLYRLAAYQVMGSLIHAAVSLCQLAFLNYNDSQYTSCVTVGFMFHVGGWMKACFGCWITFHLFCLAVLLKNMRKLEPLYVISSVLFPIAISSIPLITKSYGPTGEWCWIKRHQCGENYLIGFVEQIAEWYGPVFVILVIQCIAILSMMITVFYRAHRKPSENVFGREQNYLAFKHLLPLVAYPILFCILIIPPLVNRVYGFASSTPNGSLQILLAACLPAWSFCAGLTLIVHIGAIKRNEITHVVMLFMLRERAASRIKDETTGEFFSRGTGNVLTLNTNGMRSSTYFSIPNDT